MDYAEVRNAADPEQPPRAERRVKRRAAERLAWYHAVLETPAGRAVFWDLIEGAHLFETIFARDPLWMAHLAGRHSFGLELVSTLLEADEALYLQMETEGRARTRRAETARAALATPAADEGV